MPAIIDFEPYFSPEAIEDAYFSYKESKTGLLKSDKIKIPIGADGVTWVDFEKQIPRLPTNISKRVLNGEYYFYPFREVDIPKPNGGTRALSVAGIRDAIVQRQLYEALYPSAESIFTAKGLDQVSFAYRKGKSAPHASLKIWEAYNRGYGFALDADIREFFNTLNHNRLMDLIDEWIGRTSIPGNLLWRFIRTNRVPYATYKDEKNIRKYFQKHKPYTEPRTEGVPQGGVLSGMLANLYLHEFDQWVVQELGNTIDLRYFRYADDFVILVREGPLAESLLKPVGEKLSTDLLVEMHSDPEKTKVSEIGLGELEFVGFQFMKDKVRARKSNIERFKCRFRRKLREETKYESESYNWEPRLNIAITYCVNPRILGLEPEPCPNCGLLVSSKRSWMAYFAQVVTDEEQLKLLDRWMRKQVSKYFRDRYRKRLNRKDLRKAGMRSLVGEYYRLKKDKPDFCKCEIESPELDQDEWGGVS